MDEPQGRYQTIKLNLNISHQFSTSKRNSFSQINFRQNRQSFYGLPSAIEDNYLLSNFDPVQLTYFSIPQVGNGMTNYLKIFHLIHIILRILFPIRENEVSFSSKLRVDFGSISLTAIPKINFVSTTFKENFLF